RKLEQLDGRVNGVRHVLHPSAARAGTRQGAPSNHVRVEDAAQLVATHPVAVGAPMIELDACAVLALGNEITNVTLSPTNYRSSAFPVSFTRVSEGLGGVTRPQRRPVHSLALSSRSI